MIKQPPIPREEDVWQGPHLGVVVPLLVAAHLVALLQGGRLTAGIQAQQPVQHQLLSGGGVEHLPPQRTWSRDHRKTGGYRGESCT